MPKGEPLKPFMTKVVGSSHKNDDGTNRQIILKTCHKGEALVLIHSPVPQDKNAVKVCRKNGEQIGWLNQILAAEIAPRLDKNSPVDARLMDITGGGFFSGKSRGCNIQITKYSMR
jgi:hypothetical protein